MGVVTGIPMEFQFGTNWARFSRDAGGVIGQTLAMEGVFSFFLESTFLGLFVFGEKQLSPKMHWVTAFLVFLGSWLSGFFIIATDAWMQHPTGYKIGAERQDPAGQLLGSAAQPVDSLAVSAQHDRGGGHRQFCDGVDRARFIC